MSLSEKYYKNTARCRGCKGTNDKGDTVYEAEETISCRFDYEQREIIDSKGNKVLSTALMLCGRFISPLSIVFDENNSRFTVKACRPIQGVHGGIDHFEVSL